MLTIQNILLFLSLLLSGLIMGLLYGYTYSVNPGLARLTDGEYLRAMQSINREILNPYFFISFLGTLFILPITTWYSKTHATPACFYLLLAASIIYVTGVVGVTFLGNVPLNNALNQFNVAGADAEALATQRERFEIRWNVFHLWRTFFSVIAVSLTILGVINNNNR